MISIRPHRYHTTEHHGFGSWPMLAAAMLTTAAFSATLLALRLPAAWAVGEIPRAPDEPITFVAPRVPASRRSPMSPPRPMARRPAVAIPAIPSMPVSTSRVDGPASTSREHEPTSRLVADSGSTSHAAPVPGTPLVPGPLSPLLVPSSARAPSWYDPPRPWAPFGGSRPLSALERDSTLAAMSAAVPDLAARQVPTQAQRDAAAKQAMLKMRLAGRILLVPPDNSGGLITSSIPLPFLSAGPSRARRARDSSAFDDNRARLERLRQRADSVRRARADTTPA